MAKRWGSLQGPVTLPKILCPAPSLDPPTSTRARLKRKISGGQLPQGQVPRLLSSRHTEGASRPGPSWPSGSSDCPNGGGEGRAQAPQTATHADGRCHEVAEVGMRERFIHDSLKAWAQPVGGLGRDSGALWNTAPSLFPGPPNHPLDGDQMSWRAQGRRRGPASYLTPHLMTTTPPTIG